MIKLFYSILTNSKNQLKLTLFVFLMPNFVNKGSNSKEKRLTLTQMNKENLGPMGKARTCTPASSAFAEMPRWRQVLIASPCLHFFQNA